MISAIATGLGVEDTQPFVLVIPPHEPSRFFTGISGVRYSAEPITPEAVEF